MVLYPSSIDQNFTLSLTVFSSPNGTSSSTPSNPIDSYTKSLLHFNGASGSTIFTDETGKTWTAMGDAKLSTSDKKFGTASLYLDGTGDYIKTASASSDYYLDGDFTIDYWAKMTKSPSNLLGMVHWGSSAQEFYVFTVNANTVRIFTNGGYTNIPVSTITTNTWYHWAIVRSGNTIRLYKNGVYQGSRTDGTPIGTATDTMEFGRYTTSQYFQGYVDEIRVSKGIARWTSDFEVPASEYGTETPTPTPTPTQEPIDPNTKSLLHFNGTAGSTTISDESGKTWTAMGNAQLSTADKMFGPASLYLDGSGDYIRTASASPDYYLDGDFTIDYWAKMTKNPSDLLGMVHWGSSAQEFYVFTVNANTVRIFTNGGYTNIPVSTINTDTWYHWAIVRSGDTIRLYKNGVYQGSRTDGTPIGTATDTMEFGRYTTTQYFQGYVDELRVSKGIARWTTDFTPPASEY